MVLDNNPFIIDNSLHLVDVKGKPVPVLIMNPGAFTELSNVLMLIEKRDR